MVLRAVVVLAAAGMAVWGLGLCQGWAQHQHGDGGASAQRGPAQEAPSAAKEKMQAEEREGEEEQGPPEGWKFTLPKGGNPRRGRALFVKLECFGCHEVKGERFKKPDPKAGTVGPELSAMAPHNPPEFFAESIINPNAVIDKGRGYEGPDGSSKMPSFNEYLTVKDLLDLVTYLVNLKPPAPGGRAPAAPPAMGGHKQ
jgi:mono/diheme cytochrome c family protein